MDYEAFWEKDPQLVRAYRDAHELKIEQENQRMYMQGLYNYNAFQSVIGVFGWGLGGRKGAKPDPYMDYPIPITAREKEAERKRSIAKTLSWVKEGQ